MPGYMFLIYHDSNAHTAGCGKAYALDTTGNIVRIHSTSIKGGIRSFGDCERY
jgi:hypothetical protein